MREGALYEVEVRRVMNRPEWTVTERLRFAGLSSEGWTMWLPENLFVGSKAIPLRLDEIASLKEVAEVDA